jgi:ribosomal protein S18 acetylase RimI-like enzyme
VEFTPFRNPVEAHCTGMTTVEIRTLTTNEWAILRDTRFASLRDAPEAFTSTVEREEHYAPEVWQLRTGASAIAFADGEPAGIVGWVRPEGLDCTFLVGMWVHPAHRRRGIASGLVDHVVAATSGERLLLHVLPTNQPAEALYRSSGFVADGTEEFDGVMALRMRHDPGAVKLTS